MRASGLKVISTFGVRPGDRNVPQIVSLAKRDGRRHRDGVYLALMTYMPTDLRDCLHAPFTNALARPQKNLQADDTSPRLGSFRDGTLHGAFP